jgi:lipopolysaccharide export system permease protein
VCFALLAIILSVRFVNLLAEAAAGKYAVDVLMGMVAYRIPDFLQTILPLGFYLAVLLVYGRLYMESEMVVLFACGVSQRQLLSMTLVSAFLVALLVAVCSFWAGPLGIKMYTKILDEQRNRSEFDMLNAGRFQSFGQGQAISYVQEIVNNHRQINNVFVARAGANTSAPSLLLAREGEQILHEEYGKRYWVLRDGNQYEGQPGTAEFRITHFETYGQYMQPVVLSGDAPRDTASKSTAELLFSEDRVLRTALQWRLALPIMVFVIAFLAVPFSKTNPRQGRFLKILPAILVFVFYFVFLGMVRGLMEQGKWPLFPGLWALHGGFLLLGYLLFNWDRLTGRKRQPAREQSVHA